MNLPFLILGLIPLITGPLIIWKAEPIARVVKWGQDQNLDMGLRGDSSPQGARVAGVGFTIGGLLMVIIGVFDLG